MRINLRYVLVLLCVILVVLYGLFYFYQIEFRDLTANLIASLLTILVIDQIVEKWKLQKTERSINYVKRRITSVYLDLVWRMQPPKDWQERLKSKNSNWDDYYGKVWSLKEDSLHSLGMLSDRYHYLIDAELKNDVIEMVELLDDRFTWMMADPSIEIERKGFDLHSIAGSVTNVIFQSINTIKRHRLIEESKHRVITSRKGEPPKTKRKKLPYASVSALKRRYYKYFKQILEESIDFRDKCWSSVFPKPEEA